jgi:hypothetical protein
MRCLRIPGVGASGRWAKVHGVVGGHHRQKRGGFEERSGQRWPKQVGALRRRGRGTRRGWRQQAVAAGKGSMTSRNGGVRVNGRRR